jgi:hypothetical protein
MQPAEFLLKENNEIAFVSYSDGPLARLTSDDVLRWVGFLKGQK